MAELDGLKLLRRIEEGVAGKTGEAFFRQIVCDLSHALGAHGAFTSTLLPNRRARMMAFWIGGAYETCLEYALEGTPCEFVYRGEITAHARNVGQIFPADRPWFEQLGVQSYLGIPVKDDKGTVCGHVAVMDTKERDWADADVDVLRLFSLRAAAEIERIRYQRELEAANAAAESATRAKSVFISQMSHELRTPLNGILGFVQLLRRDDNPTAEKVRDTLSVIERSGEHLLKLVNDLLDLARIEAGKLELAPARVDLCELLEHVASLVRVRAGNASLTLEVDVRDTGFVPVMADERAVRQVLLNLLGNAVKFTDAGGRVKLSATAEAISAGSLPVCFVVEDSGIGIEEAELTRVFEPFHRVANPDRRVEGTGLGLTITQRLIAAMGGSLAVSSQRGAGSRFEVRASFPLAPAFQVAAAAAPDIVGYDGPVRTVLVVDDDRDNRKLLRSLLESLGFLVQEAGDGREALVQLQSARPDLVLTDLVMPSLDGISLVRLLRVEPATRKLPVIAMSASASDVTREEALQAGCSRFVAKPLVLKTLLIVIGEQLQLEWRRRAPAAPPQSCEPSRAGADGSFCLAPELASELQDLARQGDVLTLASRIDESLSADESARAFCSEIRSLAARYDIRGIRRVLEQTSGYAVSREPTT